MRSSKPEDIIDKIKAYTFRQYPKEEQPTLLPTLPNLYGLDIRFKYTEKMIKADKDRKKIKKKAIAGTEQMSDKDFYSSPPKNRHGRLDSNQNYISPVTYKIKKRRNIDHLFKTAQPDGATRESTVIGSMYTPFQERSGNRLESTIGPADLKSLAEVDRLDSLVRQKSQDIIDDYNKGLEALQLKLKMQRDELKMKSFESKEFEHIERKQKLEVMLRKIEEERQAELEKIRNEPENLEAKALFKEMRDNRLKADQESRKALQNVSSGFLPALVSTDKDKKIDIKDFKPKAETLIHMTPQEKEELFSKLKFITKRNEVLDQKDPATVEKLAKKGEINPCDMYMKQQELIDLREKSQSQLEMEKQRELKTKEDQNARKKKAERQKIKAAFSGMNELENIHFQDLIKNTMKEIS